MGATIATILWTTVVVVLGIVSSAAAFRTKDTVIGVSMALMAGTLIMSSINNIALMQELAQARAHAGEMLAPMQSSLTQCQAKQEATMTLATKAIGAMCTVTKTPTGAQSGLK